MPRYIDADDIEKDLVRYADSIDKTQTFNGVLRLIVRDTPTADVVPVKHGKWEYIGGYGYQYRCSECIMCVKYTSNYCPHCGARMDGENDE